MKIKEETITVELKNGTVILGTIVSIDNKMNVYLKSVKITKKNSKNTVNLDNYNIRGSMIRYIIFSETLPIDTLLIDDGPRKKGNLLFESLNKN